MKKFLMLIFAFAISLSILAQGNKGGKGKQKENPAVSATETPDMPGQKNKSKDKDKDKQKKDDGQGNTDDKKKSDEHDRKVWDGVNGSADCGKLSKNQPAKVRSSFQRDYPNATNVRWTKCRGDWTATFSGGLYRSTAVYHANGDRRDTRTPITRNEMPKVTLDSIFKKRPGINIGDVIKIELPGKLDEIFRVKTGTDAGPEFIFFNKLGEMVKYDY